MRMANCHGQRIGGVGSGNLHAGQQDFQHRLHLRLFGSARADDRLFHQSCGVLANEDPAPCCRQEDDAARMGKFQRRLCVGVDENFLDRRAVGRVFD